jgi:hypothetical protein
MRAVESTMPLGRQRAAGEPGARPARGHGHAAIAGEPEERRDLGRRHGSTTTSGGCFSSVKPSTS